MKTPEPIWILEDDPGAQFVYEDVLGDRYSLRILSSLEELGRALSSPDGNSAPAPALMIADLKLPDGNFLHFVMQSSGMRALSAPFIVVSSMDDLDVLKSCFEEGALDYLTKPFTKNELVVKVDRILARRGVTPPTPAPSAGEIELDPIQLRVRRGPQHFAQLTAKELQIFAVLHRMRGQQIPRSRIQAEVWGETVVTPKTLDVHLFNLRKKVAKLGLEILFTPPDGFALRTIGVEV